MKLTALSVVLIINVFKWSEGSLDQPVIDGSSSALMYLSRYGYIDPAATNPEMGSLRSEEAVSDAIKEFQAFAGLNQTGLLDEETVTMMSTPRCGVVDKVGFGSNARRKKRYALQGSRWKVTHLSYKIAKYPRRLTKAEVDTDIARAFKVWSDITELTFSPAKRGEKVHIEIRFERGEHGDGDPFDGAGGTLAHAYFPIYGGDAHFDDSEVWTVNSNRGTNLLQVAAHEFGHSLGLSHSDVQSALMAPFYRGYERNVKLDIDDITGIQSLYGRAKAEKPTKTPFTPSGGDDGAGHSVLCSDGSFDAITNIEDVTYLFKGSKFWKLNGDGVVTGYPKRISSTFSGIPSYLDAVFSWTNGKTYFFKGSKYWRSTGTKVDMGYPKSISKGFAGIPNDIDAVFVWSGNGKIYFFKDTKYYKFDPIKKPPVSSKYPKSVSSWEGIPDYIDDALQYSNGYTYFFKNGKYWRFNDRRFRVDSDDPPYPRAAGVWWYGCPDKGSQRTDDQPSNPDVTPNPDNDGDDDDYGDNYNYYDSDDYHQQGYYRDGQASSVRGLGPSALPWVVLPLLLRFLCL